VASREDRDWVSFVIGAALFGTTGGPGVSLGLPHMGRMYTAPAQAVSQVMSLGLAVEYPWLYSAHAETYVCFSVVSAVASRQDRKSPLMAF
jgi:hypothetical protein